MDNLQKDICTIQIKTKWVSKLIRAVAAVTATTAAGWVSGEHRIFFHRFPFVITRWKNEKQKTRIQNKLNTERWQRLLTFANTNLCSCYQNYMSLSLSDSLSFDAVNVDGTFFKKFFEIFLISSNQRFMLRSFYLFSFVHFLICLKPLWLSMPTPIILIFILPMDTGAEIMHPK